MNRYKDGAGLYVLGELRQDTRCSSCGISLMVAGLRVFMRRPTGSLDPVCTECCARPGFQVDPRDSESLRRLSVVLRFVELLSQTSQTAIPTRGLTAQLFELWKLWGWRFELEIPDGEDGNDV